MLPPVKNCCLFFPSEPKSTLVLQIENKYIFNELDHINQLRNRIAHHEPVCSAAGLPVNPPMACQSYRKQGLANKIIIT